MAITESVSSLRAALQSGSLKSIELVERCLSAIERRDQLLRAWVSVDAAGARENAARADDERMRGIAHGVLHGIPVGIKDIVDVEGTVTGAGSPLRMKLELPAQHDASLVTALRRAGAIIMGKTVTTQFACFDPPLTQNPHGAGRTPGGSSSGSAAAVAAGMIPAAIGSQTGGSITRPASYCGICGMKPTFGTVPLDGVIPVAPSLDHPGPLARTVGDLRIMLQALTGITDVVSEIPDVTRLKLGRLRGVFEDRVDPQLSEALDSTFRKLAFMGAVIIDLHVPDKFSGVLGHHRRIMATELAAWHRERFHLHRDDYGPCVASLIEEGLKTSHEDYAASKSHQRALTSAMAALFRGSIDAMLTPAAPGPAPDAATTGDPCMNSPWSYTGLPTISFPIGKSVDGFPLAIQLAGSHQQDWHLLNVAETCEQQLGPVA